MITAEKSELRHVDTKELDRLEDPSNPDDGGQTVKNNVAHTDTSVLPLPIAIKDHDSAVQACFGVMIVEDQEDNTAEETKRHLLPQLFELVKSVIFITNQWLCCVSIPWPHSTGISTFCVSEGRCSLLVAPRLEVQSRVGGRHRGPGPAARRGGDRRH